MTAFVILNDDNYSVKLCSYFRCSNDKFHILPAFLPPTQSEYLGLSNEILLFRKQHSFLFSANAYKLRYENGIDIYGFDLLIQLVRSLKEKGINVGLVFCLPMIGDMEYYQRCLSLIKEMNIDDNNMNDTGLDDLLPEADEQDIIRAAFARREAASADIDAEWRELSRLTRTRPP